MNPDFKQLDLIAEDMDATIAFYRELGLDIPEDAIWRTSTGAHHVDLTMPGGMVLHFDSEALTKHYDQGWKPPTGRGTRSVFTFKVESRAEVDRIHDKLVAAGHESSQPPFDAFWGARYTIIVDPDGHIRVFGQPLSDGPG